MKGLFIPEITAEMFRNGCLESIETLMAEGEMYDIDYQQPCEDAISRDELLKTIDTWDKFGCDADTKLVPYQDHYVPYIHYDDVVKCIKGMPSVTPQPKVGKWIRIDKDKLKCSECEVIHYIAQYPQSANINYCPNCGAKMEVEE